MQSELKRVVYVSEKTDVSDTTLKDIIASSKKNNPEGRCNWMLIIWKQLFPSTSRGARRVHKHTVFKNKLETTDIRTL